MVLEIVIVGGGIGGLTAASALRRDGHNVTVIERVATNRDVGAGLQLAPNATRALAQMGLLEVVRNVAVQPHSRTVRRWNDGSVIHVKELGEPIENAFHFPYLVVHRADLLGALAAHASDPTVSGGAITIEAGHTVTQIDTDGESAVVRTDSGREWRADLVIGADGIHSLARRSVGEKDEPTFNGDSLWIGNVRASQLDPHLHDITGVTRPGSSVWLGPGRHVVHYPVRGGELVTFGAIAPSNEGIESYTAAGDLPAMLESFAGWDPRLIEFLGSADEVYLSPLRIRTPLSRWSSGHVALLGDACHPMLPYQAQGAAQAIEDALVLADELREIDSVGKVPDALRRYEDGRRGRATAIQAASANNGREYHVTSDEEQQRRDDMIVAQGGNASLDWDWLWRALPTDLPPAPAGVA